MIQPRSSIFSRPADARPFAGVSLNRQWPVQGRAPYLLALAAGVLLACLSPSTSPARAGEAAPGRQSAATEALARAYEVSDFKGLTAASASNVGDSRFLAGTLAAADMDWDAARAAYEAAIVDPTTSDALRKEASGALLTVLLAQGEYAAANRHAAARSADFDADATQGVIAFARILANSPAPQAVVQDGTATVRRDLAGLYRSPVRIGTATVDTVLDTGANFSVITASGAARAGLDVLEPVVRVNTSTAHTVEGRLALADVQFGGATFENAVFIVLPDSALRFNFAYRIDAILGFPQLSRFGALQFNGGRVMLSASRGRRPAADRNLHFKNFKLYADASVDGVPLTLLLDTGARRSFVSNQGWPRIAPERLGTAVGSASTAGAGGSETLETRDIRDARIAIGPFHTTLNTLQVRIAGDPAQNLGVLGQDVLSAGRGFTIDFDAMRLGVEPKPSGEP